MTDEETLIPEAAAATLWRGLGTAPEPKRTQALEILSRYGEQQKRLGKPLWPEDEARRIEEGARVLRLYTDPKHGLSDEANAEIDRAAFGATKPEEAKAAGFNRQYLAHAFGVDSSELNGANYTGYRKRLAAQRWHLPDVSDTEMFNRIKSEAELDMTGTKHAVESALQDLPAEEAFNQWRLASEKNSAFDAKRSDEYRKNYRKRFEEVQADVARLRPDANRIFNVLSSNPSGEQLREILPLVEKLNDRDIGTVMSLLDIRGQAARPQDEGTLMKSGKAIYRSVRDAWKDAASGFDLIDLSHARSRIERGTALVSPEATWSGTGDALVNQLIGDNEPAQGMPMRKLTAEEKTAALEAIDKRIKDGRQLRRLQDIADTVVDPVKSENWIAEKFYYSALPSTGIMLNALVPGGVGLLTNAAGYMTQEHDRLLDAGVPSDKALNSARLVGSLQAAGDALQAEMLVGRIPLLKRIFKNPARTTAGQVGAFATGAGINVIGETGVELFQDHIAPALIQEITKVGGDVGWLGKDGVIQKAIEAAPETAGAMVLLGLIGSGAATYRDVKVARQLLQSTPLLQGYGLNDAQASEVRVLSLKGELGAAGVLFRKYAAPALKGGATLDKASAAAGAAMAATEARRHKAALGELDSYLVKAPEIQRTEAGWKLHFPDGTESGEFASHDDATEAKWQHTAETQLFRPAEITRSIWSEAEKSGLRPGDIQAREFEFVPHTVERAVEKGLMSKEGAELREQQAQALVNGETVDVEYGRASALNSASSEHTSDSVAGRYVLGLNKVQYAEKVRRITTRFFAAPNERAGGIDNPLTAVEEDSETVAKDLLANGQRDWLLSALREYEGVTGDKVLRTKIDADLKPSDLIEGFSHIATAVFVGRTMKGSAGKFAGMQSNRMREQIRGLFNLRIGSALDGIAELYQAAFRRAAAIERARGTAEAGGKTADLERMISQSLGLSEQTDHERGVEQEAGQIATELDATASLVVVHNLSQENVLHARKMGGLAMPSVAVVRSDLSAFDSFGDVTLIGKPSLIDPKRDRSAKVFSADAYSPRYPTVKHFFEGSSGKKLGDFIGKALDKIPSERRDDFHQYGIDIEQEGLRESMLKDRNVMAAFLADTGKLDLVKWGKEPKEKFMRAEQSRNAVEELLKHQWQHPDTALREEFKTWVDDVIAKQEIKTTEKIFDGFTYSGKKRYLAHNLDTVIRIMKRALRDGEGFNYGVGSIRAVVAPKFRSIEAIQKQRDKIVTKEQMTALKKEADDEFIALSEEAAGARQGGMTGFGYLDAFSDDMKALAQGGADNWQYLREMYPDEDRRREILGKMRDFLQKLRDLPTEYFEAKIQRSVGLNEFEAAVVPHGASAEVINALNRSGLAVTHYNKGDAGGRRAAVEQAATSAGATFSTARITPAQDAEYLDAVKRGDMATAQRMVDDAAKAAFYAPIIDAKETQVARTRWIADADRQIAFYEKELASIPDDDEVRAKYAKDRAEWEAFSKDPDAFDPDEVIAAIHADINPTRGTVQDSLKARDIERKHAEKELQKARELKQRAPSGAETTQFETGKSFVTRVFHATPFGELDTFDDDMLGGFTGAPSAKMAHFFAGSKSVAESYFADQSWLLQHKGFLKLDGEQKKSLVNAVREELGDNPTGDEVARLADSMFEEPYDPTPIENTLHEVFVNLNNPLVHDFRGGGYRDISYRALLEKAEAEGHDGVVMANTYDAGPAALMDDKGEPTNIVAVLRGHANQIKSADPITRDESGNVIPLSERFNPERPEITFSMVVGNLTAERREELKRDPEVFWHGSASGDLRGGATGLHLGTFLAAKQALNATIGTPLEGEWDGTREYGKTMLAGRDEIRRRGEYATGYSADASKENHLPTGKATFSNGEQIPLDSKPNIQPFRIVGKMSNSPTSPHGDWQANGRMRGNLKRGVARSGFFYGNISEDAGSISAVVPRESHVEQITHSTAKLAPGDIEGLPAPERDPDSHQNVKAKLSQRSTWGAHMWGFPESMPKGLIDKILSWPVVSQSPYGFSYYDITNKSWGPDPDGHLRVADHWNYESRGDIHGVTDIPVPGNSWTLARKDGSTGKYRVIESWSKNEAAQRVADDIARLDHFSEGKFTAAQKRRLATMMKDGRWTPRNQSHYDLNLPLFLLEQKFEGVGDDRKTYFVLSDIGKRVVSETGSLRNIGDTIRELRKEFKDLKDGESKEPLMKGLTTLSVAKLQPGDIETRVANIFNPFQRNPELRRALGLEMQRRAIRVARQWEAAANAPAPKLDERDLEVAAGSGDKVASKRLDDLHALQAKHELELGGAAHDGASRAEIKAIRAKHKVELAKQREGWKDSDANASGKGTMMAALRTLDAIASALPPEVRAKVGGFTKVAELSTDEARLKEIERRGAAINEHIEQFLRKDITTQFAELLKRAQPKGDPGEKLKGKIGPDGHRFFVHVHDAIAMTADAARAEMDKLELVMLDPDAKAHEQDEALERWSVMQTFGGFESMNAAEMDGALRAATDVYSNGRKKWLAMLAARKAERDAYREEAFKELGGKAEWPDVQITDADEKERGQREKVRDWFNRHFSFQQLLADIFGNGKTLKRYEQRTREQTAAKTDAMRERITEFRDSMLRIFRTTSWREAQTKLAALQEKIKKPPVTFYSETQLNRVEVPTDVLRWVLDGTRSKNDFDVTKNLSANDLAELERALALNDAAPANEKKGTISFEHVIDGTPLAKGALSQLEGIHFTMLWRQEQYRKAMTKNGVTVDTIADIEKWLTPEAKEIRAWLADQYDDGYQSLNEVFSRMFGVDLPRVSNYAPGYFEVSNKTTELDPFGSGVDGAGFAAGFLKRRKDHLARPIQIDALQAYWQHVMQTEHWKAFAELTSEMRSVLGDKEVNRTIAARSGAGMAADVNWWIDTIEKGGVRDAQGNSFIAKIMRAMTRVALAYKAGVLLKQLPAAIQSLADIPADAWRRSAARVTAGQGAMSVAEAYKLPVIQRRIESGYSPEMRAGMRGPLAAPGIADDIMEFGMTRIGYVDAAFTSYGAAVVFDHHFTEAKAAGMSDPEARKLAMTMMEQTIGRTAQPGELMDRSRIELEAQGIGKLLFMFQSANRQAWSIVYAAAKGAISGKKSKAELGRVALTYFVLVPLLTQTASGLVRYLFTDDDLEEAFDWKDYAAAMALGPSSGIMFLGAVTQAASEMLSGTRFARDANPLVKSLTDLTKAGKHFFDDSADNFTAKDFGDAATGIGLLLSGFVNAPTEAAGVTWNVLRQILGLGENLAEGKGDE